MLSRKPPKVIFEAPLSEIPGSILDISAVTPCRLRFIDCCAFVDDQVLRIVEIVDLRGEAFSAISYVWKGNAPPSADGESAQAAGGAGSFEVKGAEDGDMISIDVVRCACIASLLSGEDDENDESDESQEYYEEDEEGVEGEENEEAEEVKEAKEAKQKECLPPSRYPNPPLRNPMAKLRKARYLWLDRLCIMQTNKQDKRWQIMHMFNLYRYCTQCLVLPGGIQRLVPLDEETSWVHRAWTLQEVLAPVAAFVLFAWKWGAGELSNSAGDSGDKLQIVIPGRCAVTKLSALITACICGKLTFRLVAMDQKPPPVQKKGKNRWIVPAKVLGAKTRNLFSLRAALSSTGESRERGIWQNVFGRTSSRPVDMIFSIIGLFGVTLDPSAFDVNDRKEATIALAQAILRKGGSASWIGIATRATPFAELSTFPEFPQTSVAGKAMLVKSSGESIEAHSLVDGDEWFPIKYEPYSKKGGNVAKSLKEEEAQRIRGKMGDDGYLTFTRRASAVIPVTTHKQSVDAAGYAQTADGKLWDILDAVDIRSLEYPKTAAVPLGRYINLYEYAQKPDSDSDSDSDSDFDPSDLIKFILMTEHAPDKFHIVTYFAMRDRDSILTERMKNWSEFTFSVGGPKPVKSQA